MSDPSLLAQIVGVVRKLARVPRDVPITPETGLVEDLGIDSLDLFAVFVEVQDRFDVIIDLEEMPELHRVGDLAVYVTSRRAAAAA